MLEQLFRRLLINEKHDVVNLKIITHRSVDKIWWNIGRGCLDLMSLHFGASSVRKAKLEAAIFNSHLIAGLKKINIALHLCFFFVFSPGLLSWDGFDSLRSHSATPLQLLTYASKALPIVSQAVSPLTTQKTSSLKGVSAEKMVGSLLFLEAVTLAWLSWFYNETDNAADGLDELTVVDHGYLVPHTLAGAATDWLEVNNITDPKSWHRHVKQVPNGKGGKSSKSSKSSKSKSGSSENSGSSSAGSASPVQYQSSGASSGGLCPAGSGGDGDDPDKPLDKTPYGKLPAPLQGQIDEYLEHLANEGRFDAVARGIVKLNSKIILNKIYALGARVEKVEQLRGDVNRQGESETLSAEEIRQVRESLSQLTSAGSNGDIEARVVRLESLPHSEIIDNLVARVIQLEEECSTLRGQLANRPLAEPSTGEPVSYNGVLVWRIANFSQKRADATSGKEIAIHSPPFWSSTYGYKMCAKIYLNGDGFGKGSHISLFFVVMKGDYDALQAWPFQKKITMMLLDQGGGDHYTDAFNSDHQSACFHKPKSDMNIASGSPLFMPLDGLNHREYIKDNVMFIKIIVE